MKEILLLIRGKIQGVGFRALVKRIALSLQIRGWVQNRPDGTVLILAQGTHEGLLLFQERLSSIHHKPFGPDVEGTKLQEEKELGGSALKPSFLVVP
ncbi:MAG: acylphosphatase [Candidatus Micrarchaeota archaeon]